MNVIFKKMNASQSLREEVNSTTIMNAYEIMKRQLDANCSRTIGDGSVRDSVDFNIKWQKAGRKFNSMKTEQKGCCFIVTFSV